ncbi:MAG: DHA2 family efflux MFS transporter permease subunit, partial [Actinomycetota bacterium]|nr:DHA2 family efflux MFS transporter permease subunit [Actinomycetota bacterium]
MQRAKTRGALALTCIPAFMVALDQLVVTTTLPSIRTDVGASLEELGWTLNAYVLAFGVFMLTGAVLGDRFGRRRMFSAGVLLFGAASAACALAPSGGALIAARAVQGVGAALVMPLSLALLTDAFPPQRRGMAIGIYGGVTGSAVALGPIVGGAVAEGLSWQWIFWINVPLAVVTAGLASRALDEAFGERRPVDLAGLVLASGGLTGLVWGVIRGNDSGWGSTEIVLALAGGALMLLAFAAWQARAPAPMLPRRVFESGQFVAANGATFLMAASLVGAAFLIPQFLQTVQGDGPLEAGLKLLPWTAISIVVTPLAGSLADRVEGRALIVPGLVLQGLAFAWMAAVVEPGSGYATLMPPLLLAGIGIGIVFPAVAHAIVGTAQDRDLGLASAVNNTFREIGAVFGVAVAIAVFTANGGLGSP